MKLDTTFYIGAALAACAFPRIVEACPSGDKHSVCIDNDGCSCDNGLHCDFGPAYTGVGLCMQDGAPSLADSMNSGANSAATTIDQAVDAAAAAVAAAEQQATAQARAAAAAAVKFARTLEVAATIGEAVREFERAKQRADDYATEAARVVSSIPVDRLATKVKQSPEEFLALFSSDDDGGIYFRYAPGRRAQLLAKSSAVVPPGAVSGLPASITKYSEYYNHGLSNADRPAASKDHRNKQSLVDDQGERGTCQAMAVTGAIEALNDKRKISKEYAYWLFKDQDYTSVCKSKGAARHKAVTVLRTKGLPEEWLYAYMPWAEYDIRLCPPGPTEDARRHATIRATGVVELLWNDTGTGAVMNNPRFLEAVLDAGFYPTFSVETAWKTDPGGMLGTSTVHDVIVDPTTNLPRPSGGGHAMLLVGYQRTDVESHGGGFVWVKNSWGADTGNFGYLKFSYDYVRQYARGGILITGLDRGDEGSGTATASAALTASERTGDTTHLMIAGATADGARKYLSVTREGDKADLHSADDYSGRQRWRLVASADGSYYNIVVDGGVDGGRKYLSSNNDGTRVDLWTADDGSGRQRWIREFVLGTDNASFTLRVKDGVQGERKYLSSNADGTVVDLWTTPGNRQRWQVDTKHWLDRKSADELASAKFRPIIHSGGKCLDVTGGASANGTKVRGWECNGADAQLWRLDAQRRLVSKNGKCLDAWGTNYDAKKNGIPLTVWDCHDGKNQKWRFDGPYFTADNGMNLDLNRENGILHLWEAFTTPNQHWVFGD